MNDEGLYGSGQFATILRARYCDPKIRSITKTDGLTSVIQGRTGTYTIVPSNAGPTAVTGATVTDVFPAQLTGVTWTCPASGGSVCPASGSGDISATVDLASGGSATSMKS